MERSRNCGLSLKFESEKVVLRVSSTRDDVCVKGEQVCVK